MNLLNDFVVMILLNDGWGGSGIKIRLPSTSYSAVAYFLFVDQQQMFAT